MTTGSSGPSVENAHPELGGECFILANPLLGFPGCSSSKESACNAGDPGLIPGLGRSPGEGIDYPLQYSSLENPHGQRSLVGYSPWGHTTEQLSI